MDKFYQIKQDRVTRFMEGFTHISESIDKIYKELTKNPPHSSGGTAYLSLENKEEPFNGGIKCVLLTNDTYYFCHSLILSLS